MIEYISFTFIEYIVIILVFLFCYGPFLIIPAVVIYSYFEYRKSISGTKTDIRARAQQTEAQVRSSPLTAPSSEDLVHSEDRPLSELASKNTEPPLANHRIMQEVLSLHTPLDQKVIKMIQQGASLEDIEERFGPEVAATADEIRAKVYDQLRERLYPLVAAGLTVEHVISGGPIPEDLNLEDLIPNAIASDDLVLDDLISADINTKDLIKKLESTATTPPLPSDQLSNKKSTEFTLIGSEPGKFIEGASRQVTSSVYERDPRARRVCLAHHGLKCVVCGLDFAEAYGELGEGFIHVHHLRPLSEIAGEYEVNPITDLVPVCPNCHAMLHRRIPPLSPEELRKIRLG